MTEQEFNNLKAGDKIYRYIHHSQTRTIRCIDPTKQYFYLDENDFSTRYEIIKNNYYTTEDEPIKEHIKGKYEKYNKELSRLNIVLGIYNGGLKKLKEKYGGDYPEIFI